MRRSTRPRVVTVVDVSRALSDEDRRRHQGAEPNSAGIASERAQRDPRVGRTWAGIARPDALQVVGAEERVEAEVLAGPGHTEEVVVGRALLRFGKYA